MSFKFTADLGWLKVEGETETAADFVSVVSALDGLGHTADRQEVMEWLRTIPEEGWFWDGLADMFENHALPYLSGLGAKLAAAQSDPHDPPIPSNSMELEPSEPFEIPVRECELGEDLDVIDLAANPVVDSETPQYVLDTPDEDDPNYWNGFRLTDENGEYIHRSSEETRCKQSEAAQRNAARKREEKEAELARTFSALPEEPVPVVDQMVEAANRVQAPDERVALKSEFRGIFDNEVLGVKSLEKTGMVKVGWLGNRLYGKCWPTKDDIELLKRMIAKAHEPVCDPPRAEPEPNVVLNPDAKLRRITFTPEAALRLCDLLSDGLSDAVCALRMNESFNFDGSPLTISDIAEFRRLYKGDIGSLETGRALSFGNYRSVRAYIERVFRAQGEIVVEYQKKEAVA